MKCVEGKKSLGISAGTRGACEVEIIFPKCELFMSLPVFSFAVYQKIVEKKKHPLLNISGRDFHQDPTHEHLSARVSNAGPLRKSEDNSI